jgi:hypothetical protein
VHTWQWELYVWSLGTAGIIAIVALLICFNGVQQRYWNSKIQINAFIAALSQLSQSALIVPVSSSIGQSKWTWLRKDRKAIDIDRFDAASRGPDGAFRLLWHLRLRPHLVSFGALLVILMLAFSSFAQQSVAINTQRIKVPKDSSTHLKRAGQATYHSLRAFGSEKEAFRGPYDADESVAMVQALLSDHIDADNVTGECLTDFCSWKPYTTMSICATTEDISDTLLSMMAHHNGSIFLPNLLDQGLAEISAVLPNTSLFTHIESLLYYQFPDYEGDMNMVPFSNLSILFYDPCKAANSGMEGFARLHHLENWTAIRAAFRPCAQVFTSTYEKYWRTEIETPNSELHWYAYFEHGSFERSSDTIYCTTPHSTGEETCIRHSLLSSVARSILMTYNVSATIRQGELGFEDAKEEFESQRTWKSIILDDIRKDSHDGPPACNEEAFTTFNNRIQSIAASVSMELRNNENGSASIVNGTAWITGT